MSELIPDSESSSPRASKPEALEAIERKPATQPDLVVASESFEGPLPPPQILAEYERLLPGSADRIFKMAEAQARHRRALEKRLVAQGPQLERLGMLLSFCITFAAIAAGFGLIFFGKGIAGFAVLLGVVLFHAGVNLYARGDHRAKSEPSASDEGE